jgi:hypothetical protein
MTVTEEKTSQAVNLLELKPQRTLEWETLEDGRVALLIPRFRNRFAVKWFLPMFAKPHIRLKLDGYGSFVWSRCDGKTAVEEIGKAMSEQFGEAPDPLYERIGKFLHRLEHEKFLVIKI